MMDDSNTVDLAIQLTAAWLSNPNTRVTADDVPQVLATIHDALSSLGAAPVSKEQAAEHVPAVSVRKSLASSDRIVSMIDGKAYASLKRHLKQHKLTPNEYRQRYKLKSDYPMVAPAYSEARRAMAKTIGLGRKAGEKAAAATGAKKVVRGVAAAKRAAKAHLGGDAPDVSNE